MQLNGKREKSNFIFDFWSKNRRRRFHTTLLLLCVCVCVCVCACVYVCVCVRQVCLEMSVSFPFLKRWGDRVVCAHDIGSRGPGFEAEFSSWEYDPSLPIAFHYHLSIFSIWLNNVERDAKQQNNHNMSPLSIYLSICLSVCPSGYPSIRPSLRPLILTAIYGIKTVYYRIHVYADSWLIVLGLRIICRLPKHGGEICHL